MDTIDRQAAIEDIRTMIPKDARLDIKWVEMWLMQLPSAQPETPCYLGSPCEYQITDAKLPSAQPEKTQLSGEDATKDAILDCISRKTAIDAIAKAMPSLTTPDGCGEFDHDIQVTDEAYVDCMQIIHELPSAQPEQRWIPCSEPPGDDENVFIAHGTENFMTCCIGHYDHESGLWYEDRNWFAKPIFDNMYWCEMPILPKTEE